MARMGLEHRLQQSLGQQMLLLPRMLQSIEVLQLSSQELSGWLQQAAEENEALVLEQPVPSGADLGAGVQRRGSREDSDRHDQFLQSQPARDKSLVEQVEEQLTLFELDETTFAWVRLVVQCLDEAGLLAADDEFLYAEAREQGLAGEPEVQLGRAIAIVQSLEPRGIGARNVVEALVLQLDPEDEDFEPLRELLRDYLEEIAKNKLPAVARAMGFSLTEVRHLVSRLRGLSLRPGASLTEQGAPTLHPEVVVEWNGSDFEVRVEDGSLPAVTIDGGMRALAADKAQPADVKSYVRDKIDRARWVVDAVEMRRETLARIAARVFEHQRSFLQSGPGHRAPLMMKSVADELGVHISTVSRAVAGKYVQTPWGIFPLREFFQAATSDAGRARDDVRELVRELVEAEDRARPLSDDDVVERLGRRGIELARRTVAKYRKELGIPSSYRRRVH